MLQFCQTLSNPTFGSKNGIQKKVVARVHALGVAIYGLQYYATYIMLPVLSQLGVTPGRRRVLSGVKLTSLSAIAMSRLVVLQ
jgi:hypothetical protein